MNNVREVFIFFIAEGLDAKASRYAIRDLCQALRAFIKKKRRLKGVLICSSSNGRKIIIIKYKLTGWFFL